MSGYTYLSPEWLRDDRIKRAERWAHDWAAELTKEHDYAREAFLSTLVSYFCKSCWRPDPKCQCGNDE